MTSPATGVQAGAIAVAPIAEVWSAKDERLRRLRANDALACEEFVLANSAVALSVARRILGSEADALEAAQDAFLSFFRALPMFNGEARLSTWFHRIAINAALMKRRSRRRKPECSIEGLLPRFSDDGHRIDPRPAWSETVDELVQRAEMRSLVRAQIDALPEEYRNVLLLRDIEELDTAETARVLSDTPGAVKTRLHRARQALRTLLEREVLSWTPS